MSPWVFLLFLIVKPLIAALVLVFMYWGVALVIPLAYWLELMRRALLGNAMGVAFPIISTDEIIGLLMVTTLAMCVVSYVVFRMSEHIARERGQIDRATGD